MPFAASLARLMEIRITSPKLRYQACLDLAERSMHSILGYLLIWLICIMPDQFWLQHNDMTTAGSAYIFISVYLRIQQLKQIQTTTHIARWEYFYAASTLANGLFWGGFIAWLIVTHPLLNSIVPLIAAAGIASASITNLTPYLLVCRGFILLLLGSVGLGLFSLGRTEAAANNVGLLVITYMVFLFGIAGRLNREYWQGLENEWKLTEQASELRRLHEQAVTALKLRTQFLANMSHEIRTPMNGVLGLLELLRQSPLNPEQQQHMNTAYHSGQNLLALLNDILDLSRLEAGRVELEQLPFSLTELLQDVHQLYHSKAQQQNCALSIQSAKDCPPWLLGDRLRLWQILSNLLSNALKFTEQGEVRIELNYQSPILELQVIDTGIGISPEQLDRIFDNFTQADGSMTRRFGGTGLGLSIVRHLVGLMNGKISLSSQLGQGSQFRLELPLLACEAPVQAAAEEQAPLAGLLQILLVEDNKVNQMVATGMLKRLGHQVSVCEQGLAALVWLEQHSADLILMDVQMPIMDGLTATQRIRERQLTIPIIGLTAHALETDRLDCLNAGMDDVLTKPIELTRLAQALQRWRHKTSCPLGSEG